MATVRFSKELIDRIGKIARENKHRTKNEVVLDVDIGRLTAMSTAAKFGL
jgi:hypothetical protein